MQLNEIQSETLIIASTPLPVILSNEWDLFVAFYGIEQNTDSIINEDTDEQILVFKFKKCSKYTFGIPGHETLHAHPYYKLGLNICRFYEVKDSDFLHQVETIKKSHPYYNPDSFKEFKHYIITFHDKMFECVSAGYEILNREETQHKLISSIVDNAAKTGNLL